MLFRVDVLPDLSMPQYAGAYGGHAPDLASGALAEIAAMLPDSPDDRLALRYEVDPGRPSGHQTTMYLKLPLHCSNGCGGISPAEAVLRRFYALEPTDEASLSLSPETTLVYLQYRENAFLIPGPIGPEAYYGISLPDPRRTQWPPRRILDELFSSLSFPAGVDIVVHRSPRRRELVQAAAAEVRHLSMLSSTTRTAAPLGGSTAPGGYREDPLARRMARRLEDLLDLAGGEDLLRFTLRVWSTSPEEARSLAHGVAGVMGGGGLWDLLEILPDHPDHGVLLASAGKLGVRSPRGTVGGFVCCSEFLLERVAPSLLSRDRGRMLRLATLSRFREHTTLAFAQQLLRLPSSDGPPFRTIRLDSEDPGPTPGGDFIRLGVDMERERDVAIPARFLPRHVSLFGCPGTGKTITVLTLIEEFFNG